MLTTLIPKAIADTSGDVTASFRMIAILGLVGGFAERLVPNLVRGAAEKLEARAGTPVQATGKTKDSNSGQPKAQQSDVSDGAGGKKTDG